MQLHFILTLAAALLAASPASALPFANPHGGVAPSHLYHAGPSSSSQHAFNVPPPSAARRQKPRPSNVKATAGKRRREGLMGGFLDLVSPRSAQEAQTHPTGSFTKRTSGGKKNRRQRRRKSASKKRSSTTCQPKSSNSTTTGGGGDTSGNKNSTSTSGNSTTVPSAGTGSKNTTAPISSGSDKNATTSSSNSTSAKSEQGQILGGYWPNWTASKVPPESIDWDHFDYMNYAFAIPKSDSTVSFDGDKTLLTRLVKSAHGAKSPSKVVLSVGGWGNSAGFSGAVASDSSRKKFVQTFVDLQKQYNLDGFDFDWEYPNNVQNGRRASSDGQDTTNFQTFLQQLRAALPAGQMITAAVPQTVWLGSNGQPVGSVARAGDALDYIVIMNYDVNGASSTPGPNAPLANLCGNSSQPTASAAAGVKQWTAAGMPRKKILLGVPAYGYVQNSSKLRLKGRSLKNSEGTTANGQVNFNLLVEQGALKKGSDGLFDGANGWTKYWDDCSDTPYLANGQQVVTYDDTSSMRDKAAFSKLAGIAGVNMWSIDGDTKDGDLRNALLQGFQVNS